MYYRSRYYRPAQHVAYMPRFSAPSKTVRPGQPVYALQDLMVAAAVAHRVNGGQYIKPGAVIAAPTESDPYATIPHPLTPNKDIAAGVLAAGADSLQITVADRELAENITTHYRGLTFKVLTGAALSEFENSILRLITADEADVQLTTRDIGLAVCLPSMWVKDVARKSVDERLGDTHNEFLGTVGAKITVRATVARCVYSQQWNTYYVTAITDTNHAVFFAAKSNLAADTTVTVQAKVKAHRVDERSRAHQTQLNYAKVTTSA